LLNKYLKCSVWRLALRYDIYIYIYMSLGFKRLMYELKKIGKVFTSKFLGTAPSSYKKRIYRAAVSQRLRNTALGGHPVAAYVFFLVY